MGTPYGVEDGVLYLHELLVVQLSAPHISRPHARRPVQLALVDVAAPGSEGQFLKSGYIPIAPDPGRAPGCRHRQRSLPIYSGIAHASCLQQTEVRSSRNGSSGENTVRQLDGARHLSGTLSAPVLFNIYTPYMPALFSITQAALATRVPATRHAVDALYHTL